MSSAQTRNGALHVPTIDITPYRADSPAPSARAAVARQVDKAARTVGFMQIVGHGAPLKTLDDLEAALDAFFALSLDTKMRYQRPPHINRGYSPPKSEALANSLGLATAADLFEAFNIGVPSSAYPALDLPADDYAPNVYPAELPGFAAAVGAWFGEAGRVARVMTRIFGDALGLGSDCFARYTDHSIDVLRLNNYRLPAADAPIEPDQVGMGAHTDYGIVTILWADQVPGLQILGTDRQWHPVQPAPGALLVNLGDAMARWTNDQWLSTMHRVAAPRIDGRLVPRRSAAYFHDGNIDAVIECLPTCSGPDAPALYEPTTVGEHLSRKLAGSRDGVLNLNAQRETSRLAASRGLQAAGSRGAAAEPRPPEGRLVTAVAGHRRGSRRRVTLSVVQCQSPVRRQKMMTGSISVHTASTASARPVPSRSGPAHEAVHPLRGHDFPLGHELGGDRAHRGTCMAGNSDEPTGGTGSPATMRSPGPQSRGRSCARTSESAPPRTQQRPQSTSAPNGGSGIGSAAQR